MTRVSFRNINRASKTSNVTPSKKLNDERRPLTVRKVKGLNGKNKKNRKLFRVNKVFSIGENQKKIVRHFLKSHYIATRDLDSYSRSLNVGNKISDADLLFLQTIIDYEHLFRRSWRLRFRPLIEKMYELDLIPADLSDRLPDKNSIDSLVAKNANIEWALTTLQLLRKLDCKHKNKNKNKSKLRYNDEYLIKKSIDHLCVGKSQIDAYAIFYSKMDRLSWFSLSEQARYVEKKELISWLINIKLVSDEMVKMILTDGILENQFHNISFIFSISQHDDFRLYGSQDIYKFLLDLIENLPNIFMSYISESDFLMTKNVLSLLNKSFRK